MNDEQHFAEVQKTMFDLDGAIQYATESIAKLRQDGAPPHLIEAMEGCRDEIRPHIDACCNERTGRIRTSAVARASRTSLI